MRGTSTVNPSTSSVLWRVVYGLELYKDLVKVGSRQKALEEYTQCERAMRKIRGERRWGTRKEKEKEEGVGERREKSTKLWKIPLAREKKYCEQLLQYVTVYRSKRFFLLRTIISLQNIRRVTSIEISLHPNLISRSTLKSLKAEGNPLIPLIEPPYSPPPTRMHASSWNGVTIKEIRVGWWSKCKVTDTTARQ